MNLNHDLASGIFSMVLQMPGLEKSLSRANILILILCKWDTLINKMLVKYVLLANKTVCLQSQSNMGPCQ